MILWESTMILYAVHGQRVRCHDGKAIAYQIEDEFLTFLIDLLVF